MWWYRPCTSYNEKNFAQSGRALMYKVKSDSPKIDIRAMPSGNVFISAKVPGTLLCVLRNASNISRTLEGVSGYIVGF